LGPLDLRNIALRGSSLDELLEIARLETGVDALPSPESAAFIQRWALAYAKGDGESLLRRLQWDGVTEEGLLGALAVLQSGGSRQPGPWIDCLEELLARYGSASIDTAAGTGTSAALFEPDEEPAFAELWGPVVEWARQRLERANSEVSVLLRREARRDLDRSLVGELSWTAELALYERFRGFCEASDDCEPEGRGREGRVLYDRFLESMFRGGFEAFVTEFSVLARQLCRLVDTWIEAADELVRHLAADVDEIGARFGGRRPPGTVSRIRTGLSDPHNGGRRVAELAFDSGLRLIYKPRSIELEAVFSRMLAWMGDAGLDPAPAPIRCLPRDGYGWVEFVSPEPAASRHEAFEYFRRAGALLCIAHVLNASDLHLENVVASAAGPILVDLETLLQPRYRQLGPSEQPDAEPEVRGSVLGTGLLAAYQVDTEGRVEDIGGLAAGEPPSRYTRRWAAINSDAMRPEWSTVSYTRRNVMQYRGEPQRPEAFVEQVKDGFAAACRFLMDHRGELTAANGPLSWFAGLDTRWVHRPSDVYARVLHLMRTPRYQRDGLTQGLLIDALNRGFRGWRDRPDPWPLVAAERRALLGLDVPHFAAPIGRCGVWSPDGELLAGLVEAAGLDVVEERLSGLDDEELGRQLQILDRVLGVPRDREKDPSADGGCTAKRRAGGTDTLASAAGGDGGPLVKTAARLAGYIREVARKAADGSATWAGVAEPREGKDAGPLGPVALYNGDVGVLLFLAALARVTRGESDRGTVLAAVPRIAAEVDVLHPAGGAEPVSLGACDGLGGIVWALTWIGVLLDDPEPARLARSVARRITDEAIAADARYDVTGGAAGAVLGLLALSGGTGDPRPTERAVACADHLVAAAAPAAGGGVGWTSSEGLMLAGMAHGAAGIACALARLFEVTGRETYRETAQEAYRFERSLFDPDAMNWPLVLQPDPDGEVKRIFPTNWCHGAPGMALGRIAGLGVIDGGEVRAEIEAALRTTGRFGIGPLDHLCCGNMGRAEVFLTAGRRLGNVEYTRTAATRAVMVVDRFLGTGSFGLHLPGTDGPDFDPGFFQGYSGIGYEFLRVACPDVIPSVLAFESPSIAGPSGDQ